jgi:hypothetical protein
MYLPKQHRIIAWMICDFDGDHGDAMITVGDQAIDSLRLRSDERFALRAGRCE